MVTSRVNPRIRIRDNLAFNGLLAVWHACVLRVLFHIVLNKETLKNVMNIYGATHWIGIIMERGGIGYKSGRYLQTTVKWLSFKSILCPSYVDEGTNAAIAPKIHAVFIIFATVEALKDRGILLVERYFSRFMTTMMFIVMNTNTKEKYRTILHDQPLWKTSKKTWMHVRVRQRLARKPDRAKFLSDKFKFFIKRLE